MYLCLVLSFSSFIKLHMFIIIMTKSMLRFTVHLNKVAELHLKCVSLWSFAEMKNGWNVNLNDRTLAIQREDKMEV